MTESREEQFVRKLIPPLVLNESVELPPCPFCRRAAKELGLMHEKRGVIDENTPGAEGLTGEPGTKEAADKAESHLINDMIDAVADRTDRNQT